MTRKEKKKKAEMHRAICKLSFLKLLDVIKINYLKIGYSEKAARNESFYSIDELTEKLTKEAPEDAHIWRSLKWELKKELG